MASWVEIERVRKDPKKFRALATRLLAAADDLSEWETVFLESVSAKADKAGVYSLRQSEKLLQIRDDIELIDAVRGFSVKVLIAGCYQARADLPEEDEAFIVAVHERATGRIRRGQAGRLMRCAALLGIVEEETVPA